LYLFLIWGVAIDNTHYNEFLIALSFN